MRLQVDGRGAEKVRGPLHDQAEHPSVQGERGDPQSAGQGVHRAPAQLAAGAAAGGGHQHGGAQDVAADGAGGGEVRGRADGRDGHGAGGGEEILVVSDATWCCPCSSASDVAVPSAIVAATFDVDGASATHTNVVVASAVAVATAAVDVVVSSASVATSVIF